MKHLTLTLVFLGGVLGAVLNPALADEKKPDEKSTLH